MSANDIVAPRDFLASTAPTERELTELRSFRERAETESLLESNEPTDSDLAKRSDVVAISAEDIAKLFSERAYQMIIDFEVGGRAQYDKIYRRPEWPQGDSGVTIGVGYDLGYNKLSEFEAEWQQLLASDAFTRLAGAIGKRRNAAAAYLPNVRDIDIPWQSAELVYRATTVQKFSRIVIATFPNARALHPHAFGALLSLVFNRGSALKGDRRREMLNIRNHMESSKFAAIPAELRSMCRLWPEVGGLLKRRKAEAKLFEDGLLEMAKAERPALVSLNTATSRGNATSLESLQLRDPTRPDGDGDWSHQPDDITEDREAHVNLEANDEREAAPAGWRAVSWISDDNKSSEYRHIAQADRDLRGCSFTFTARDLELLIRSNAFEVPPKGRIVFGLRGAVLEADTANPKERDMQVGRAALNLKETRPDHQHLNCVIGIYDRASGRLSGFTASTVPNRAAVWGYTQNPDKGGNLLPCGCYLYEVGTHHKKTPGCLREAEAFTVVRSAKNLVFDTNDDWDHCEPFDNIHPAFKDAAGSAEFSSLGCQTIRGSYNVETEQYSGEWAQFRLALGLSPTGHGNDGDKYYYVLLTGLEAAIASRLRDQRKDTEFAPVFQSLVRLRQGSHGDAVRKLQIALGVPSNGIFDATTKKALAVLQKSKLGFADGVYSPASDAELGLAVFGGPDVIVASAAQHAFTESLAQTSAARSGDRLEALYAEVGRRSKLLAIDPARASEAVLPQYETLTTESLADAVSFGKRIYARLENSAHELICGDADGDAKDRGDIQKKLMDASSISDETVVKTVSEFLALHLSIISPIAAIVARILVEKVLGPSIIEARKSAQPALACACTSWAKSINDRHADVPSQRIGVVASLTAPAAAAGKSTSAAGGAA